MYIFIIYLLKVIKVLLCSLKNLNGPGSWASLNILQEIASFYPLIIRAPVPIKCFSRIYVINPVRDICDKITHKRARRYDKGSVKTFFHFLNLPTKIYIHVKNWKTELLMNILKLLSLWMKSRMMWFFFSTNFWYDSCIVTMYCKDTVNSFSSTPVRFTLQQCQHSNVSRFVFALAPYTIILLNLATCWFLKNQKMYFHEIEKIRSWKFKLHVDLKITI